MAGGSGQASFGAATSRLSRCTPHPWLGGANLLPLPAAATPSLFACSAPAGAPPRGATRKPGVAPCKCTPTVAGPCGPCALPPPHSVLRACAFGLSSWPPLCCTLPVIARAERMRRIIKCMDHVTPAKVGDSTPHGREHQEGSERGRGLSRGRWIIMIRHPGRHWAGAHGQKGGGESVAKQLGEQCFRGLCSAGGALRV